MRNIRLIVLNGMVLVLAEVFLCLCFGCSGPANSRPTVRPLLDDSEVESPTQPDRPPTAKTLYATADIFAKQGRDSECDFLLKRIVQEYPEFLPAYNSLAELQMRQGRTKEAIETITKGLVYHPRDPVLLNNLGVCWIALGDYEKALEKFTEAVQLTPQSARYRTNSALALGLMGRYDESLSLYRQVLSEDQANHNVAVLRDARGSANRGSTLSIEQ